MLEQCSALLYKPNLFSMNQLLQFLLQVYQQVLPAATCPVQLLLKKEKRRKEKVSGLQAVGLALLGIGFITIIYARATGK